MKCYECRREGCERDAVVLCHKCLAALCETHLFCIDVRVTANEPLFKIIELPLPARLFLCLTCRTALEQCRKVRPLSEFVASNILTAHCAS